MTTILKSITGTKNLSINIMVAFALTLIIISLLALVTNCLLNPSLIVNASF